MSINNIIIKSVTIKNYKIYADSENGVSFNFGNNKAILITGSNGYGKTTLVEAIEWCLSGDVGRVSNCYYKRNTTSPEKTRDENLAGLFKNKTCKDKPIEVSVVLLINNEEILVKRKQVEEGLDKKSQFTIEGRIDEETKESLKDLLAKETYYKYNVCDTLKSYRFLTSKRQDIYELFQDFLKDRSKIDEIIEQFLVIEESIQNDNMRFKNELNINLNKLEQKEPELIEAKKNYNKVEYPLIKIFESEEIDIYSQSLEDLELQLKILKNIGIIYTKNLINKLIVNEEHLIEKKELQNLFDFTTENYEMLSIVLKNEYYSTERLDSIVANLRNLSRFKELVNEANNIDELKKSILANQAFISSEQQNSYEVDIESLNEKSINIRGLEVDIQRMEKGNKIISALSDIAKNKEAFLLYRNQGATQCPLCGGEEKFSNILEESQIGIEAEKYLEDTNSLLLQRKISLQTEKNELDYAFNVLKSNIYNYLNKAHKEYIGIEAKFRKYYNDSYDFVTKLLKNEIKFDLDYKKTILMKINYINFHIRDNESKNKIINELKNFLVLFDNSSYESNLTFENLVELRKLGLKVKSLINEEYSEMEFQNMDFDILNSKINSLQGILIDNKIKSLENEINTVKKNNETLLYNVSNNEKYLIKLNKVKNSILEKQKNLERLELDSVGPYIFEIYKKIIRHSNIKNIKLARDKARDGGSVLVDDKDNNILNTFSQGQLGILIIAYFFANMFRRKDDVALKAYFMDDITNCLDDMNVYSFIDMVKHLLYSQDKVLNQFFFSTCEENIEKLFINKMKSYNIGVTKVKFFDYGNCEITEL